jgi:hypothetical protein
MPALLVSTPSTVRAGAGAPVPIMLSSVEHAPSVATAATAIVHLRIDVSSG